MNLRHALLAVLIGAVGIMMSARPASADDAAAAPIKMGVCDPIGVFNKIQEGKDVQAKLREEIESLNNQAKVKKDQLDTEAEEIKLLVPTSDEFQSKMEKLTEDQADTQAWFQAAQVNLQRKQREEQKGLFDKIISTISQVAKDQGLTIVINSAHVDFPQEMDKMDPNAFVQMFLLHTCLYNDPSLDITDKVVIAMDKQYSASPAPAPAPSH
jgi:Skp family chaperone for outer membrane proteins